MKQEFEFIIANGQADKHIAVIQLNRPKEFNALNLQLMNELKIALMEFDRDDEVRVIVLTGNEKAFAAGGYEMVRELEYLGCPTVEMKSMKEMKAKLYGVN